VGQNNIIELNGKQYDAITGKQIGQNLIKATPEKRTAHHQASGRALDGVVRAKAVSSPQPSNAGAKKEPANVSPITGKRFDVQRPQSHHAKRHQAERSKTLMRHIVKKPIVDMKPSIKTTAPTELAAKPSSAIGKQLERKLSASQVNPLRLSHAQHIPKSHHIKRHAQPAHQTVAPAPHHQTTLTTHPVQAARPHVATQAQEIKAPAPQAISHQQHEKDIFEAALARAQSHTQPTPRAQGKRSRRNRRLINAFAGLAAFMVIGGFVAYLNMSKIELQVASIRAGFHASMPQYNPTGYALNGDIQSRDGQVAMQFRSGDSAYEITQVASDWNSQTLLDYYTENHGTPEQTIQSQGRTIFLYDNSRAAWVNGGVRYEIKGNSNLSASDLVAMATSL
jgi:hypothetical protein